MCVCVCTTATMHLLPLSATIMTEGQSDGCTLLQECVRLYKTKKNSSSNTVSSLLSDLCCVRTARNKASTAFVFQKKGGKPPHPQLETNSGTMLQKQGWREAQIQKISYICKYQHWQASVPCGKLCFCVCMCLSCHRRRGASLNIS